MHSMGSHSYYRSVYRSSMSFIERSKVFYIVYVTCCFVYGCMSVIDCNVQVFGRIISCIDDVMRLDR